MRVPSGNEAVFSLSLSLPQSPVNASASRGGFVEIAVGACLQLSPVVRANEEIFLAWAPGGDL